MTREQDIAWLAGLLEGEACFDLHSDRRPNYRSRLRVRLEMCDKDVVVRAADIFPTKVNVNQHAPTAWNDSYIARWNGVKAEEVMRAVLPYMGERRSAKIRECLSTPNLSHHPKERKVTS